MDEVSSSKTTYISERQSLVINEALMKPFWFPKERCPSTLYADVYCCFKLLRDVPMHRLALSGEPREYTIDDVVEFIRHLVETWEEVRSRRWTGPVPFESLLGDVEKLAPTHDNSAFMTVDDDRLEDVVLNYFTAALLASTRGRFYKLVDYLYGNLGTLGDIVRRRGAPFRMEFVQDGRTPPLPARCCPTAAVGRIYEVHFGYYPSDLTPIRYVEFAFRRFNRFLRNTPRVEPPVAEEEISSSTG